jgi:predicted nuclease of predicted toxin-antitoxin system
MNLKLDENIDARVITLLRLAGYDVATVPEQGLMSAPDEEVIEVCRSEGRCLVTCDKGFGNRVKYNPSNYPGIVIIRLPSRYTFADWQQAIEILNQGLESSEIIGKLWIIKRDIIQEYQPIESDI